MRQDGGVVTHGTVTDLFAYPIKGLSPQRVREVTLAAGEGFPGDREWALGRAGGSYRHGTRQPIPKSEFHVLVSDARLAGLTTRVTDSSRLEVYVQGHVVLDTDLDDAAGRRAVSELYARVLDLPADQLPVIAREPGRRFTDVSVVSESMMNAVSFINLASIRELQRRTDTVVNPLRFRANVYIDGLPPFSELALVGSTITVGDLSFEATLNTRRCAATEVDPETARRDIPIPRLLMEHYGHAEMGVYGIVRTGGTIRAGDAVRFEASVPA